MTEPIVEQTLTPEQTTPITPPVPAAPAAAPETPSASGVPEPAVPAAPAHTENIVIPDIKYQDAIVKVEIPPDLLNFTEEKGIDAASVVKEMYSETGLSAETKQTLYDAFGKWQVDAYLEGIEAKNKAVLGDFKAQSEASAKASEEAWKSTLDIMGGEDRWADLDAYAIGSLSEAEINEFNQVMKSGSMYVQKLLIADLWGKFNAAGKPVAPKVLDLETGDNLAPSDTSGAISQAEYFAAFKNGEYRKDPKLWDAKRSAGLKKGI